MALAAATVWEVRTAGADDNGGGFVTGATGTDFSQQDSKRLAADVTDISTTDGVGNATTTFTSATANFTAAIVGNIICLQGGTGALVKIWRQVTARASATSITLDAAIATGTGITVNIGGAIASPGMVGASAVSGNYLWIRAGTYTVTSAIANVSGGCITTNTVVLFIEGYQTTRGDMGTKPLIQADGVITSFTFINQLSNGVQQVKNIKFDGNSRTSSKGIANRGIVLYCEFLNFTNNAISATLSEGYVYNCSATGCSTSDAFTSNNCINCVAFNNTVTGFNSGSFDCEFARCVSDSNSGASSDGFATSSASIKAVFTNCIAFNNGRHGFFLAGTRGILTINCIAEGNAGWGFTHSANVNIIFYNCAGFNNTSGNVNLGTNLGSSNNAFVTLTASPFTDALNQNFGLNNIASAGAACRAAGFPGVLTGVPTSTGYLDMGTYQHQDSASGSGGEHSNVF